MSSFREWFSRLRSSSAGRVLANAGWASASTPITAGLGIVQAALLARMLGPDGLGALAVITAVCAMFGSLLRTTSAETTLVYLTRAHTAGDHTGGAQLLRYLYHVDFLTGTVSFLAVAAAAVFLPRLLQLPAHMIIWQVVLGLTLPLQATFWVSHASLRVCDRFAWTCGQAIGRAILRTAATAVLFACSGGLGAVVLLNVVVALLDAVSLAWLARRALPAAAPPRCRWKVPGEVWRYQLLTHGRQSIKSLSRYGDTLVLSGLAPTHQVGLYSASKQITDQLLTPAQGLLVSLFPEYSRLYFSGDLRGLRHLVLRFALLFLAGGALLGTGLWMAAPWLVHLVLGPAFLPGVPIIRVLAIGALATTVMTPLYALPTAVGRAGPALTALVLAIAAQIGLMIALVPCWGATGAAWARVAYVAVWMLVLLPQILHLLRRVVAPTNGARATDGEPLLQP